jgi:hypothetical protein
LPLERDLVAYLLQDITPKDRRMKKNIVLIKISLQVIKHIE